MTRSVGERLSRISDGVFAALPERPTSHERWLARLWMAALYVAGVAHWAIFYFSAPKRLAPYVMQFDAYQWPREYVFLTLMQKAVRSSLLPLHVSPPLKETTRLLGIPDYVISPQILLLKFLSIPQFIFINTILLFTACFVGCLLIRRRYRLSLFAFTTLLLIVGFNGNLTAQIGAGQYVWIGFLLLPFVVLLLLRMVEGDATRGDRFAFALLLGVLILQGTYHFYIWTLMFLALVALFNATLRRQILQIVLLSVPAAAIRLFPPMITFWGVRRDFISGYPTLETVLEALLVIKPHDTPHIGIIHNLAWWEYDFYVGILGVALLVFFGLYLTWRQRPDLAQFRYKVLDWPLFVMALASLSLFYAPIASLPLPIVNGERVSTRFIILPILILATIAVIRMNQLLPQWVQSAKAKTLTLAALAIGGASLMQHSMMWRPSVLESEAPLNMDLAALNSGYALVSSNDPLYTAIVIGSALLSVVSCVALALAWLRYAKRPTT